MNEVRNWKDPVPMHNYGSIIMRDDEVASVRFAKAMDIDTAINNEGMARGTTAHFIDGSEIIKVDRIKDHHYKRTMTTEELKTIRDKVRAFLLDSEALKELFTN